MTTQGLFRTEVFEGGYTGGASSREPTCQCKRRRIWALGQEDALEKGMATTPVFLPGEFHGQNSLKGYSPWGHKELDTTEQLGTTHTGVRNLRSEG